MGRIKIGHASISEHGTINGAKGDQTKREVCIRDWYSKGWNVLLRPKTRSIADSSAKACEILCANENIGYGQNDRNSAYNEFRRGKDLSKIGKSNTDCSAFMTLCAIAGGVCELNYTSNAPTTTTMRNAFVKTGKYTALTESKYLTSPDYLKRGDILVSEGHHTVMVLTDGIKANGETKKNESKYFPRYTGKDTSLVNALQSLKIDSNFWYRERIAKANNMGHYEGTAKQNLELLSLLKEGHLKRPTK